MIHALIPCGLLLSALWLAAWNSTDSTPLVLKVYPRVSLSAPAIVRLTTRVEPHDDNRMICLHVEGSTGFEATSCVDTAAVPITREWRWRVPTGEYQAVANLHRTSGVISTAVRFSVRGDE